ncbi:hypothetical protein SDRG_01356 [Saprolegnia diclina VS20]|uniref:IST1 homolog n=1 Tax=Saprolegnia diclina (strain VS20) TaxID=1156394 RepID=T0R4U1_SAPDV|nr:hypothetical protein SDRG_01356 [Saprolegnia diclina VS20]EQC41385.1 hypothetical protein SDRG_01356 [Saprolegnia diclina VS20]|eukprot:XP_008605099.1 hypothetical protein SDRG_01356 [Saprolegnia diclina VS20]
MFGFNVDKLKPNLKMAVGRIGIIKNKKANAAKVLRKEVAKLLAEGKEEKARIRVEGLIREDFVVEAYEILELLCELVAERAALIKAERACPYDMREAVNTLIWAANRTEIPELNEVKSQLTKKYGQDFAAAALRNVDGCVNERVIHKLSVQPPNSFLVINYLKEIAKQHNVNWVPIETPAMDPLAPMMAPTGVTVGQAPVSGPNYAAVYATAPPPGKLPSAFPNVPSAAPITLPVAAPAGATVPPPSVTLNSVQQAPAAGGDTNDVPDFDILAERFAKLRKRT